MASKVLDIVAEKTGYPQDMLELDLDLEADLGIDTVKQAETLQAIREAYGIPFQEGLSLRDYPTLASVIGFVYAMRPDLVVDKETSRQGDKAAPSPAPPTAAAVSPAPAGASTGDAVAAKVLEIVATKTGYPEDMLELDLDLEADLGIDTVKQAETLQAIREAYGIPFQEGLSLRDYPTLASVIGFVYTMRPDLKEVDKETSRQVDKGSDAPAAATTVVPARSCSSASQDHWHAGRRGQDAAAGACGQLAAGDRPVQAHRRLAGCGQPGGCDDGPRRCGQGAC